MSVTDAAVAGDVSPLRSRVWSEPSTRRFLMGQALGQASDALTGVVLAAVLLTADADGFDASRLVRTIAATTVPYALVGPLAGVIADHWPRRRSLLVANLVRVACAAMAFVAVARPSDAVGFIAAAVLMSTARAAYVLRAAALPEIATRVRLVDIEATSLCVGSLAVLSAGGIGSAVMLASPIGPLGISAICAVAGVVCFATLERDLGGHGFGGSPPIRNIVRHVWALLVGPASRWAIAVTAGHRALLGALFATLVMFAVDDQALGPGGYLLAAGTTGVATLLGTVSAPSIAAKVGTRALALGAFAVPAGSLGLVGGAGWPILLVPTACLSFFAFQTLRVCADATVQACVPDAARGRVFSVYDASYNLTYFCGAAAALLAPVAVTTAVTSIAVCYGLALCALWLHQGATPAPEITEVRP